jgi:hypothetical protein
MLRRLAMIGMTAVLIGLAIGGASLASSTRHSKVADQHRRTFQLLEFQQSFVPEDGKESNKPGTMALIHSVLKTSAGYEVGRADSKCTELSPAPNGVFHCEGTDTFTDGSTIEFAGVGTFAQLDFTVTVTGGTGRYLGTSGQVFFHSLNASGTKNRDTITLTR